MPANQTDTSAASESGAEVVMRQVRSRPRPRKEPGTSSRSPRPSRHGSASSSRASVSPGQGGTPTPERRGRSPCEGASIEPASPGRQGISLRRNVSGQGGSSGYAGGSPLLQTVTAGSPFLAKQIDSPERCVPGFPPNKSRRKWSARKSLLVSWSGSSCSDTRSNAG